MLGTEDAPLRKDKGKKSKKGRKKKTKGDDDEDDDEEANDDVEEETKSDRRRKMPPSEPATDVRWMPSSLEHANFCISFDIIIKKTELWLSRVVMGESHRWKMTNN